MEKVGGDLSALATRPIGRLLWEYSLPAVVGMVVMSLYNVIDRIFIGRGVGAEAIAGLAVTFPVMNVSSAIGVLIGWAVYGLVPMGNVGAVYLATILFALVMSCFGVAVANRSSTMLQSIFVMFAFIMIFQLMGGLFTPIGSMPEWAQYVTYAIPPRYFIEIMRAVYLKGATVADLLSLIHI